MNLKNQFCLYLKTEIVAHLRLTVGVISVSLVILPSTLSFSIMVLIASIEKSKYMILQKK